jgi:hypothetical protein
VVGARVTRLASSVAAVWPGVSQVRIRRSATGQWGIGVGLSIVDVLVVPLSRRPGRGSPGLAGVAAVGGGSVIHACQQKLNAAQTRV